MSFPRRQKILFVGWAILSREERDGGGLNMFAAALAADLAANGSEVSYLRAGNDRFHLGHLRPRIYREETWRGVGCWRALGSPYRRLPARGSWWMTNPITEKMFNELFVTFVIEQKFDVLHFHTNEGFGFECLRLLKERTSAKIMVTLHDFFPVCEQGHFFQYDQALCTNSEGGLKCATCRPRRGFVNRTARETVKRSMPRILYSFLTRLFGFRRPSLSGNPLRIESTAGISDFNQLLENELSQRGISTDHQRRREENIAFLNFVDHVVVATNFMKTSFEAAGIKPEKLLVITIGHPLLDRMQKNGRAKDVQPGRTIRFAYVGSTYLAKGVDIVMEAAYLLEAAGLGQKIEIQIHSSFSLRHLAQVRPLPKFVRLIEGFTMDSLELLADNYDVGLVPHKCYESCGFTLLQHLALRRPVIISNLGGGPENLDRDQGILMEPESAKSLAAAIVRYISAPLAINENGLKTYMPFSGIRGAYERIYAQSP